MNKRKLALVMTVVVICLVLVLVLERDELPEEAIGASDVFEHESSLDSRKEVKSAPDFTLENLDGRKVSLSDYEDKIVFLNFWATWCGYCDQEMPIFEQITEENDDVVVLAVNVREDRKVVEKFVKEGNFSFPVLLDDSGKIGIDYVVGELPTTYIINKKGKIIDSISGMMDYDEINMILKAEKDID